ncbi:hypothetical protein HHK36_028178 [Tetracentron sinense]|uniref:PGG domain-containing protein n=1 Tax=Tetracentron sinense TaxID=13715 RepID=A0A834YFC6_TETSI|nr:hypothetical protein HHK36_028178 [Tetracentron sinense]
MAESAPDDSINKYGAAYKAAVRGGTQDRVTLKEFHIREPTSPIDLSGNRIFHLLALHGHSEIVTELLDLSSPPHGLSTRNLKGDTSLHEAARFGKKVATAEAMLCKDGSLISARNQLGESPLYLAAAYGHRDMFHFLAEKQFSKNEWRRNDGCTILHAAVMGEYYCIYMFSKFKYVFIIEFTLHDLHSNGKLISCASSQPGLAFEIVNKYPDLISKHDQMGNTALNLLVQSPSTFRSGTIYSCRMLCSSAFIPQDMAAIIIYIWFFGEVGRCPGDPENPGDSIPGKLTRFLIRCPLFAKIYDAKQKHQFAMKLAKCLIKREKKWRYHGDSGEDRSDIRISGPLLENANMSNEKNRIKDPLFQATKLGIVEVVANILEDFPGAIAMLDENCKNILHLAVEHRQFEVFEFMKTKKFPIATMVLEVDKNGNTALHLAAKLGDHRPKNVAGVIEQMSWEVLFFQLIKDHSMPQVFSQQNNKGQTAEEVFDKTHKNLLGMAEKWTKETTNTLMIISVLIATINVTGAFTIPGGYNQDSGYPIHLNNVDFSLFMVYLVTALIFCILTLGASISAHLSRFQKDDFYISLPLKILIAKTSLFYSLVFTVMSIAQGVVLETNGDIPFLFIVAAIGGTCIIWFLTIAIYVDITFPLYHYLTHLFIQLLPYSWQAKLNSFFR